MVEGKMEVGRGRGGWNRRECREGVHCDYMPTK